MNPEPGDTYRSSKFIITGRSALCAGHRRGAPGKERGLKPMVSYYKTIDGRISEIEQYESGCWINCVAPEEDEIEALIQDFNIEPDF